MQKLTGEEFSYLHLKTKAAHMGMENISKRAAQALALQWVHQMY